jgi:hypothetical protein
MNEHRESFTDALAADLLSVFEKGLAEDIEVAAIPALAELAEGVSGETYAGEKDYYSLQVENLLRAAIERLERTMKRREGLELLFGIRGDDRTLGLEARRGAAAEPLGYKDKETLRRGKVKKRPFEIVLREELAAHMLALADERGFEYTGRYARHSPVEHPSPQSGRRPLMVIGTVTLLVVGAIVALLLAGIDDGRGRHSAKAASLPVPVTVAPSSPNRPTYDYDVYDPNNTNCADLNNPGRRFGRCGAETGHVLNSFINTPSYHDERAFFDARLSDQPIGSRFDPLTGVRIGSTVVLRTYVDNDTAVNPIAPESSDTRDTRVRVNLSKISVDELAAHEWVLQPQAFISASNAQTVQDGVNLVGPQPFALQYQTGSAELLRNNVPYPLSDEIVSSRGAPIGLLYMNGDLPAGNNFDAAAMVLLRARVVSVAPPEIRIANQVRVSASKPTPWHSTIHVAPGDDVQWLLNTSNGPWSTVYHVVTRDILPANLELDPNSVVLTNARGHSSLAPAPLYSGGYDAGTYNPDDNTLITFTTKILGDFKGCQIVDRNEGYAFSDQTPVEVTNDAEVVITKPHCAK